jgi:glycosyltransferase involved in cell wall biosynthesis
MAAPRLNRPLLSVIVPVFNQAASIVANLQTIRERIGESLDGDFEIVVVSDGSIDTTEDELVAQAPAGAFRVFHYDRNLGKGYAIKLGALEAHGEWIGFVDADLDLDPADLSTYVRYAAEHDLDFAIGSKRHPQSQVQYPRSRVVASWLFQRLVRLMFNLDVRDTQVGLKVFRREVAEQVLPLLFVKRYAFDVELLAVARAFGFERIEEMPIRLDYRFTGSGVRSRAVLRALIDTAAIFYRLRILRYYQRRRAIAGAYGWSRPRPTDATVSVLLADSARFRRTESENIEVLALRGEDPVAIRHGLEAATGEVVALLEPGARAPGNWLSATTPFFRRDEIAAVVFPKVAPLTGSRRSRAAAAVDESRIGAGLGYFRYTPGNIRFVRSFPARSLVARREALLALDAGAETPDVVAALAERGGMILYTPEVIVVVDPPPLFRPHLRAIYRRGLASARDLRRGTFSRVHAALLATILVLYVLVAVCAAVFGGGWTDILVALVIVYLVAVAVAGSAAGIRHQSAIVAVLTFVGIPMSHAAWAVGMLRGARPA